MKEHILSILATNNIPELAAQADQPQSPLRPIQYISEDHRKEAHATQKPPLLQK